jgi:CheY-like chemotaxis protein
MTLSLEKYVGGIDVAFNGRECLRLFQQKPYDVILMDIQMPILDGYETTKAIRKIEKSGGEIRHVPIIAVTANSLSGDRENCINAGMDDYFSKPFHIEKVIARISEFLIKYPQE